MHALGRSSANVQQNLVDNCPLSNEEKDRVQSFKQRTRSMVIGVSIIFHLVFASSLLEFIGQRGKRTQQLHEELVMP